MPPKSAVDQLIEKTKVQMLIPPAHGLDVDDLGDVDEIDEDEDDIDDVIKMAHDLVRPYTCHKISLILTQK